MSTIVAPLVWDCASRALPKEFPEVKIITITGGGDTGRMNFLYVAERLGAQYTFHKPFELRKLTNAVHALLQAKSKNRG